MSTNISTPSGIEPLHNLLEAAKVLAISPRKLWGLAASGQVKCVRIGRSLRFDPIDLRRFIEAQKGGGQ